MSGEGSSPGASVIGCFFNKLFYAKAQKLWTRRLLSGSSVQAVDLTSQLALQICCLISVDNAFFSQLVDHGGNLGQLLASFFTPLDRPQVTDSVTRGLAIVTVTIATLVGLPYVFFGCLVICHEVNNFRTAKVSLITQNTK